MVVALAYLTDVDTTADGHSRWTAKGPLGLQVQWHAKIIADKPGHLIAWKSFPGLDVDTAGSVQFIPKGQETEVRVELKYDPPAGKVGTAIARLFGEEPKQQLAEDLKRFQEMMEKVPSAA